LRELTRLLWYREGRTWDDEDRFPETPSKDSKVGRLFKQQAQSEVVVQHDTLTSKLVKKMGGMREI
jgi:hypothetical protein